MENTLLRQFLSFASVGVLATGVHYLVLLVLVEAFEVGPVAASGLGAFAGALVSYGLNRTMTFKSNQPHATTSIRFLMVAVVALLGNMLLMALFVEQLGLPYFPAQIITTGVLVLLTFTANKFWTFKPTD